MPSGEENPGGACDLTDACNSVCGGPGEGGRESMRYILHIYTLPTMVSTEFELGRDCTST